VKANTSKNIFEILGEFPSNTINSIPFNSQPIISLSQGPSNLSINSVEFKKKLPIGNPTDPLDLVVVSMSDDFEDGNKGEAYDMYIEGLTYKP